MLASRLLGKTDVIAVPVGEQDRAHIGQRAAHLGQRGGQKLVVTGHARVDDRHLPRFLDQVHVDDVVADPMNPPNFRENH